MIDLETTFGAIILVMIFSVLFKETILFRIALALWLGSTVGFYTCEALKNLWFNTIAKLNQGQIILIIPLVLGSLLFFRYYRKYSFLARFPSAIMLGSGTGAAVAGMAIAQGYTQILASSKITSVNQLASTAITVLIIIYFILTVEKKGAIGIVSKVGRAALMITFGLGLGSYAIARYSHVIGRIQYVLITWLGIAG